MSTVIPSGNNGIPSNWTVISPNEPLKFTATGNSTLGITNNEGNTPNLEYSTDGANWVEWDYSTLSINDGESVYLRGNNPNGFSLGVSKWSHFEMSGSLACEGNVMSLIGSETAPEIPCVACFAGMFYGCTSLTSAPELPATTLAKECYAHMFYGCTSLTTAPELPATRLVDSCYYEMFFNCASLNNITMLATDISPDECL